MGGWDHLQRCCEECIFLFCLESKYMKGNSLSCLLISMTLSVTNCFGCSTDPRNCRLNETRLICLQFKRRLEIGSPRLECWAQSVSSVTPFCLFSHPYYIFLYFFNCGKIAVMFTILTILKCTRSGALAFTLLCDCHYHPPPELFFISHN